MRFMQVNIHHSITSCSKKIHKKIMNKFALKIGLIFSIFLFLYRLLLPFGDEPDFEARSFELMNTQYSLWIPFNWFRDSYHLFNVNSYCNIDSTVLSFWSSIESISCTEDITQIFSRFLITITVVAPILILLVFRGISTSFIKVSCGINLLETEARFKSIGFALLVPGMIYYLGLFSPEQLSLSLSLLIYLFWGSWIIVSVILWIVASIDFGNGIVVLLFIFYSLLIKKVFWKFGLMITTLVSFLVVTISYITGSRLLLLIQDVPFLANKAIAMMEVYEALDFTEKYPTLLRPVIPFMTGVFMTSSGIKVVLLYALFILMIIISAKRLFKVILKGAEGEIDSSFNDSLILMMCVISFTLSLIFIFPNYANAKYFMFLTPFLIQPILRVFNNESILFFLGLSNCLILLHLLVYRIY